MRKLSGLVRTNQHKIALNDGQIRSINLLVRFPFTPSPKQAYQANIIEGLPGGGGGVLFRCSFQKLACFLLFPQYFFALVAYFAICSPPPLFLDSWLYLAALKSLMLSHSIHFLLIGRFEDKSIN